MIRPTLALLLTLAAAPALAVDTADAGDMIEDAQAAIAAEDYGTALAHLAEALAAEPRNADVLNLLGYASRKSGDLDAAGTWYAQALAIDPDHLGALEYQGELFMELGDRAAAEANLARLTELCGACEEQADLAAALAGS